MNNILDKLSEKSKNRFNKDDKQKPVDPKKNKRLIILWSIFTVIWLAILLTPTNYGEKVSYNEGKRYILDNKVKEASVDDHRRLIFLTLEDNKKIIYFSYPEGSIKDLLVEMENEDIKIDITEYVNDVLD